MWAGQLYLRPVSMLFEWEKLYLSFNLSLDRRQCWAVFMIVVVLSLSFIHTYSPRRKEREAIGWSIMKHTDVNIEVIFSSSLSTHVHLLFAQCLCACESLFVRSLVNNHVLLVQEGPATERTDTQLREREREMFRRRLHSLWVFFFSRSLRRRS